MRIEEILTAEIPDTNAFHFKMSKDSTDDGKTILSYGYNASFNPFIKEISTPYGRKVFFNNWAPCEFAQSTDHFGRTPMNYDDGFTEVYSICPYSNKWLNTMGFDRKYRDIFYPFNANLIPEHTEKEYDVIYHGGIHGQEHLDCLDVIQKFNYRYCSMSHGINPLTVESMKYATNKDLSFNDKIALVEKCKISVCYNIAHIRPEHIPNIKSWERWNENEAFSEVDGMNIMPQFKTRMHEAAISKTLNLVQKDKWNIAEKYYEPDTEFIYFTDKQDLEDKIKEITSNWEDYIPMVEKAYNKSLLYTTDKFLGIIEKNEEWNQCKNAEAVTAQT
jgi:hypothetical protein